MATSQKTSGTLAAENLRLKAQVAQLEDRLDHLVEEGGVSESLKQAARNQLSAERLNRSVLEGVSDVVLVANDSRRLTYVSPNVHLLFGYSLEEVERHGRLGFLLPANLVAPDVLESRGQLTNIECRILDSIGRPRDLLVTAKRMQSADGRIMYTCRDITERKRLKSELELLRLSLEQKVEERTQELRESRAQYHRLVESLHEDYLFYSTTEKGIVVYVSPSALNILGYRPDQVVGRSWRKFVDTESPSFKLVEEMEEKRSAGLPVPGYQVEVRHANGGARVLAVREVMIRDADGCFIANETICRDVTAERETKIEIDRIHVQLQECVEQRTAELRAMYERLLESEHRYQSLVEDNPDFVIRWQGNGVRSFVNDAYCRYWGECAKSLVGTSFFPSIIESDCESLQQQLVAITANSPVVVSEYRVRLPDGQIAWHRWSHRALFDTAGNLEEYQSVGSDITSRRGAEERIRETVMAEARIRHLTQRECDVMTLVVAGSANKVIARRLDLSIKTIEKHRSSLMRKLGVKSVPELVRLAMLAEARPTLAKNNAHKKSSNGVGNQP
jgi:PAS domain S-box-containing protein